MREESRVTVPLLSDIHSRVLHGNTLELQFHLAVRARLKLLAKRKNKLIAATPMRTYAAGRHSLKLRLDPKRWPTKLQFQTHALAPLPTVSVNQSNQTTVSTSLRFPAAQASRLRAGCDEQAADHAPSPGRTRGVGGGAVALLLVGAVAGPGGTSRALGQSAPADVTPQTDAAIPAQGVIMLGSSPQEAPGETWGIGKVGNSSWAVVRYSSSEGWSLAPPIRDGGGNTLAEFHPDESALAGSVTPNGSAALLGSVPGSTEPRELLLVREPGQPFSETASAPPLQPGERLFEARRAPMVAAIEENGGAGALVVPVASESTKEETRVLHWSSSSRAWTSESIEVPQASQEAGGFRVLAIAASGPKNAWLLAQLQNGSDSVALFRRQEGAGGQTWKPVSPGSGEPPGTALSVPLAGAGSTPLTVEGLGEPPSVKVQLLTVTSQGVWVDGERADTSSRVTIFYKPGGEEGGEEGGEVLASWCAGGSPACTHPLPEALPTGPSRSYAWSKLGDAVWGTGHHGPGRRSLSTARRQRIQARAGTRVRGHRGCRRESWRRVLDAHRGLARQHQGSRSSDERSRTQSPAELPGAFQASVAGDRERSRIGARRVRERGPGGGRRRRGRAVCARLRLAAGRTSQHRRNAGNAGAASRRVAHAGACLRGRRSHPGKVNQMWLWRGETGLWEKDPAEPLNFRGESARDRL